MGFEAIKMRQAGRTPAAPVTVAVRKPKDSKRRRSVIFEVSSELAEKAGWEEGTWVTPGGGVGEDAGRVAFIETDEARRQSSTRRLRSNGSKSKTRLVLGFSRSDWFERELPDELASTRCRVVECGGGRLVVELPACLLEGEIDGEEEGLDDE